MTRVRLREAYPPDKLGEIYAAPHQHDKWPDHQIRVAVTVQIAHALVGDIGAAADLSCGDAAIVRALGVPICYLGDYAPGHAYHGPIEETVEKIPRVELFVCSETIEHLDDPDLALKKIRARTDALVLSTPVDAWNDADRNPEHYWAWSRGDVEEMLSAAGFRIVLYNELDLRPGGGEYAFGIWGCR